jgi:hypothetical protein
VDVEVPMVKDVSITGAKIPIHKFIESNENLNMYLIIAIEKQIVLVQNSKDLISEDGEGHFNYCCYNSYL